MIIMFVIYKFEGELTVTNFIDIEYDNGHIVLSTNDIDIISTEKITYQQYSYIAWSLYHNLKHDLSNYNFILCED